MSVALVLSGGGARGAYEAGVLSVLGPFLADRGERPTIVCGTSVGAITAGFFAATAHLDPVEQGARGVESWLEVEKAAVIRPILGPHLPRTALRYLAAALDLPGSHLPTLLDPAPLDRNIERWIDFDQLEANLRDGALEAACVVATALGTGRSVGFYGGRPPRVPARTRAVAYVETKLAQAHVRASAAIPFIFPPVRIDAPEQVRGWYVDGGARLNTPIKPALDLGADRLVVIGMESLESGEPPPDGGRDRHPELADLALNLLHGILVDPLAEDMRMVSNVNRSLAERAGRDDAVKPAAHVPDRGPYRPIPYVYVAPQRRGVIGRLAEEAFDRRYGGLKALRDPDFPLLLRALGGRGRMHGELLSYLFFERVFVEQLIGLGRADAERWIEACHGRDVPWCLVPEDSPYAVS